MGGGLTEVDEGRGPIYTQFPTRPMDDDTRQLTVTRLQPSRLAWGNGWPVYSARYVDRLQAGLLLLLLLLGGRLINKSRCLAMDGSRPILAGQRWLR